MGGQKSLNELKPGQSGIIQKVAGQGVLKKKFLDMGIIPGSPFEIIKVAPLGDPVDIKIKGYHLSLRREEAKDIFVRISTE